MWLANGREEHRWSLQTNNLFARHSLRSGCFDCVKYDMHDMPTDCFYSVGACEFDAECVKERLPE